MQIAQEKQKSSLPEQDQSFIDGINEFCQDNNVRYSLTSLSPESLFPLLKIYKAASNFFSLGSCENTIEELMGHFGNSFFNNEDHVIVNKSEPIPGAMEKEISVNRMEISNQYFTVQMLVKLLISESMSCKDIENYNRINKMGGKTL